MDFFKNKFEQSSESKSDRDPRNAPGDFYVQCNACIRCGAPEAEAPDLIAMDDDGCYFQKQPQTTDEINRAINAMDVSCIDAVRYGGSDKDIIKKILKNGHSKSDILR